MTILCFMILIWFMEDELKEMIERKKDQVRRGHYMYDLNEIGLISLNDYKDTFAFILAMTRTDYDILDNPYI